MSVTFAKLNLTKNTEVKIFEYNEQKIEIKQYLSIQEKLALIGNVLDNCQDANNFVNIGKRTMFLELEIVYKYTNIKFTEKQKEDPVKLYDLMFGSGFLKEVLSYIPEEELNILINWCENITEHFYTYRNSIYGILDAISTDYSNLELDADKIKNKMVDPEKLGFLKDVLTKLG